MKRLILSLTIFLLALSVFAQTSDETVITIKAIAGLQYDLVRFSVKPKSRVKIVLINTDEMSHNLVITGPGFREAVVKDALALGDKGPAMNYIPASTKVLWLVPVVDPGQTKSVSFIASDKMGVYPYVCTFPGHGFVMFGAMYVTDKEMPALEEDTNVPPARKKNSDAAVNDSIHHEHTAHPYRPVPPYLYRILMPDAGPAAIAVSLPHQLSYCWDAGACRLRYAWTGDFLDPMDYWNKKGEHFAKILGDVFYRDKTKYPLTMEASGTPPAVDFKGYRLIQAYPEFHYTINGIAVYELIKPKEDGTALERTFRIPETVKTIWFVFDPSDGVRYNCTAGKMSTDRLMLSPAEARQFTITMTKAGGKTL